MHIWYETAVNCVVTYIIYLVFTLYWPCWTDTDIPILLMRKQAQRFKEGEEKDSSSEAEIIL